MQDSIKNSEVLIKGVTQTIENETKEQRSGFVSMPSGTLGKSSRVQMNKNGLGSLVFVCKL